MKEIFPSLFLVGPEQPDGKTPFTYLLKRPAGNLLLATKADVAASRDIKAQGKVTHLLLGDRHHALSHTQAMADRFGAAIVCSDIEAAVLKKQGVHVAEPLPYRPAQFALDLEIIPTPGHTKGAFSYLWTHEGRRFLFIGDTIVPVDGGWQYWVTAPNRATMRETMKTLSQQSFDVILSNSFASTPVAWLEVSARSRAAMFAELGRSLAG